MTGLWNDLRYALRQLRNSPGFAAVAIITLALGIGANTGIFTLVNAVLLKSLPVLNPDQLFLVRQTGRFSEDTRFSYPLFERMRAAMPPSAKLAAMSWPSSFNTRVGSSASERITGQLVSGEYFPTLETYPALGRLFTTEDNRVVGGDAVAVISDRFWERRFSRAPNVLGQTLEVNRMPFTIIGVAARNFVGVMPGSATDFWIPAMMQHDARFASHYSDDGSDSSKPWIPQEGITWLQLLARVDSPQMVSMTTAALNQVFHQNLERLSLTIPDAQQRSQSLQQRVELEPGGRGIAALRRSLSKPLLLLMGMVGLVLLIACANIANLLLARAAVREREIAVRLAVGATRNRLVRQLMVECILLSFSGAVLGIGVAYWCTAVLPKWAYIASLNLTPDSGVLLFSCAVAIATAILFGLVPAWRGAKVAPVSALKANLRGTASNSGNTGSRWSLKQALVVSQIAFSLVLLVGAGLFVRTLRNFRQLDPGFERDHLLSVWIDLHLEDLKPEQLALLYHRLIERVDSIPGVRSSSLASCGLASGCRDSSGIYLEGSQRGAGNSQTNVVSSQYFSNVGVSLLQGRGFITSDNVTSPKVAVVNQTFVRTFLARSNPLGKRFGYNVANSHEFEIVGVVADARVNTISEEAPPLIYFPLAQNGGIVGSLDVRTAADPQWMTGQVRQAVSEVDPNLPIILVTTLSDQVLSNLAEQSLIARLTTTFGLLALGLACLGLYGVVSYTVARRTSELGIRLALGSSRSRVLWLVLRDELLVVGIGLAAGVLLSLLTARVTASLLFGVRPSDPLTLAGAVFSLLTMALAAAYIPARRATKVDPMVALRYE